MTLGLRLVAGAVLSVGFHAALVLWLILGTQPAAGVSRDEVVRFEVVETEPPPIPVEPAPEVTPEPSPVAPPPKPRPRPAQPRPPAPPSAEPPPVDLPPPSNKAPPETPPGRPVPLITGITLGSTVAAGEGAGMKVGVGNTLYGTPGTVAGDPTEAQPYQGAERWVPPHRVTTLPEVAEEVKARYPDEARREGVEGSVRLRLSIDGQGRVVSAKVLQGPGHGLDQAARAALLRFAFKPATVDGEAVATTLDYTYTFLLD